MINVPTLLKGVVAFATLAFTPPDRQRRDAGDVIMAVAGRVNIAILASPLASPRHYWELARTGVADITSGHFTNEPERFVAPWLAKICGAALRNTCLAVRPSTAPICWRLACSAAASRTTGRNR